MGIFNNRQYRIKMNTWRANECIEEGNNIW